MGSIAKSPLRLGIYDSGLGGLSVMRCLQREIPQSTFFYLADKKHNPYGSKTKEEILALSLQNTNFLLSKKIDALVIACHTSSVCAASFLRKKLSIPIFDMTSSTLLSLKPFQKKHLLLLGTVATINSGVYQKLIHDAYPSLKLDVCACPSFVSLVERGLFNSKESLREIEKDLMGISGLSFDGCILGCTHFPFLVPLLEKLYPGKIFIDPALKMAREVKDYFSSSQFLSSASFSSSLSSSSFSSSEPRTSSKTTSFGSLSSCVGSFNLGKNVLTKKNKNHFFVTKDEEEFSRFGQILLGYPLDSVETVCVDFLPDPLGQGQKS